ARAYLNRVEQTAQAFTANPFCDQEGYERVYHTGDVVRYMEDGRLQFIGRRDSQVKIRGFRIELTEVEEVVRRFPGIKDATVAAFDEVSGGKYIAAYIVSDETISIDALKDFILQEKPPYMVPAVTMQIDEIPMTQNQKVNKRALPKPVKQSAELVVPETDVQKRLFACIADAMGHRDFGITTDIYYAGLTSIGAIRLNVLLSREFDITVKTSDLKNNPTILQLEQFVLQCGGAKEYEIGERYPLTNAQLGVFADSAANPGSTVYNIPSLFELDANVDIHRLKKAVEDAVEAHPYLKMQLFTDENGQVWQKRNDSLPVDVTILNGLDQSALVRAFNLYEEPLYRFEIHQTEQANYFFMDVHHIAADGTSLAVLLADINRAYIGEELQKETYSGYEAALDYEETTHSDVYARAEKFYSQKFGDCEGDTGFHPDRADEVPAVGHHRRADENSTPELVRAFCEKHGITENVFFMGVFGMLLAKYNYVDEAVFTTIYHGRNDSRLVNTVAMLVKTLPVRTKLMDNVTDYFTTLQDLLLGAMDNDCYPFAEVSRNFDIQPNALFAYQGDSFIFDTIGGYGAKSIPIALNAAKEPVTMQVFVENGRFVYDVEYRADKFSRAFIENMAGAYAKIVQEFIIKESIREVEFVDGDAIRQIDIFNQTEYPFDREKTVIDLFREQAKLRPNHTALVYLDKEYTYKELDELTDRLAMHLRKCGIQREKVVGVLIPRCEYMVICSLGILKAGGAYLPLDPTYPPERLNLLMEDTNAKVLITTPELSPIIGEEHGCERIMVSEIPDMRNSGEPLPPPVKEDLFVMLYTSGSTGLPKGVMLEHGNLAAFCAWSRRYYDIDESAVSAVYASYGFDAHMTDTYPILTGGGTVHIVDESIRLDLVQMQKYYNEQKITHSLITTQVGRQFAQLEGTRTLKHLTVGGEKLVPLDPPAYNLYNAYGPTECTIMATIARVDRKYDDVPIGPALSNLKLYVVDKNGKLLPAGASGELWISGPQVGRSYLNRPEQTAQAFTANPFCDQEGYERVYHTGDVVRFMPDGVVQFIGRRDSQVKIRGFRIELTEVEEVIRRFPGIKDATVVARDAASGGKMLVAYVVSDAQVDIKAMNAFILQEKPPYMVPAVTMQIDAIPLNANSKVDRRKLPEPVFAESSGENDANRAQTQLEMEISDILEIVLGHRDFGVETDFAYAGLSSISAIRLAADLNKCFGFSPNVKELQSGTNILTVENAIVAHWRAASCRKSEPVETQRRDSYPLSQTQLGIYLECMMDAESDMYNIPMLLRLDPSIEEEKLDHAIHAAVEAHSFLKCRIGGRSDGSAVMIPRDDYTWQVKHSRCNEREVEAL
ncbi:MAG: amino acid adenylation domain-containing protein, partial [Clostridia bacterium]|nr:amino acid adenylation domain-containing protein [Clostridia bacterium]